MTPQERVEDVLRERFSNAGRVYVAATARAILASLDEGTEPVGAIGWVVIGTNGRKRWLASDSLHESEADAAYACRSLAEEVPKYGFTVEPIGGTPRTETEERFTIEEVARRLEQSIADGSWDSPSRDGPVVGVVRAVVIWLRSLTTEGKSDG
jgi:hypothetical protein